MSLKQEILTTVVTKLREQNAPSIDKDDNCVYRGPGGRRCALGWLIPDELYKPEIEGTFPYELFMFIYDYEFTISINIFLHDLRETHDAWKFFRERVMERSGLLGLDYSFSQVEPEYRKLALKWGLDYPE